MLRIVCLSLLVFATACTAHSHQRKFYVVDGHRYSKPVYVVHKQPARQLNCWKIKAGRWHCYK